MGRGLLQLHANGAICGCACCSTYGTVFYWHQGFRRGVIPVIKLAAENPSPVIAK